MPKSVVPAVVLCVAGLAGCNDSGSDRSTTAAPSTQSGSFTRHGFVREGLPERNYFVYLPSSLQSGAPLIVYLHGCNQDAPDAALGTRWNEVAERVGAVVVYPQQKDPNEQEPGAEQFEDHLFDGNGTKCWNWFRPEHITRDAGEAGTIAGITREVMERADIGVDPDRVYVMGISAGGIMSAAMGATYPDLYAAIGIVAGCGYPACTDPGGSLAFQAMGEHARRLPVVLFHGTADEIAPFPLGEDALHQWLGTNDWIDNGQPDLSVGPLPAQTFTHGLDESTLENADGEGDTCIRNANSPCPGGVLGLQGNYPFTVERYVDADDCPLIDFWIIHGLAHNYPGGNPEGSFVDPLGPNITVAAYNFFLTHRKGSVFETGAVDCSVFDTGNPLP